MIKMTFLYNKSTFIHLSIFIFCLFYVVKNFFHLFYYVLCTNFLLYYISFLTLQSEFRSLNC